MNYLLITEMIFQKGTNWNDTPTFQKRGRCVIKTSKIIDVVDRKTNLPSKVERSQWIVDNEIPTFSQDKTYITKFV